MQPSEPEVQSEVVAADAVSAEPRSTEAQESQQSEPSLWNRLFGGLKKEARTSDSEVPADADASQKTPSQTLTLTQAELDRKIQAETDRREAKRAREATEKAEADRREAIARKLDPSSPDFDPYGGADEQAKLKAEEAAASGFTEFIGNIGKQHDAATLDVIKDVVPAAEWNRILSLEGAGVGLDGRKLIVSEGLKALEKHWKAEGAREAEAKLQGDPIFRKKVFTEHRGDTEEPELVVGSAARGGDFMDQVFSDYQAAKGRRNGRRRSSE